MAESNKIFPDTPWWTNVFAVLGTMIVMAILNMARKKEMPDGKSVTVGSLITDTALFFPHALILFGILADAFTYEGVYSIPSLVGILAIFANKLLDYFWTGVSSLFGTAVAVYRAGTGAPVSQSGGSVVDYNGCYVQGLERIEWLKSNYSSQTLVVTATILVYYIMDLLMNKGIAGALASILIGVAIFGAQAASMNAGGCFGTVGIAPIALTSIANGIIFGGIAYGIVEAYAPARLPSKVLPSYPRVSINDLKVDESGKLVDENGNSWLTLPDGSVIPDTCSAGAGGAGGGRAATDPACPKK